MRAVAVALVGAATLTCVDATAPDLVVPIQIVATPDRDTLRLADSLVLVVRVDSIEPLRVVWMIEPHGDTLTGDTLLYRPSVAGTEYVRALATFEGARTGSAARRVVTLPNAAPIVTIEAVAGTVPRTPLGDTITLAGVATDPDRDSIAMSAFRWYVVDAEGSGLGELVGTGDTLRFPVTRAAGFRFHLVISDPAGARGIASYSAAGYDPVIPATWRTRVAMQRVAGVSRHPTGLLLAASGRMVTALTGGGAVVWTVDTERTGTPVVVGDDGGIYQTSSNDSREAGMIKLGADGSGQWTLADGEIIPAPVLLWDGGVAVPRRSGVAVLEPSGAERWSVAIDSLGGMRGLSVGLDSTLYVLTSTPAPGSEASVLAYSPAGTLQWRVFIGSAPVSANAVIPADDSTLLVAADAIYAMRPDGAIKWSRPGTFWQPAVGDGRVYYVFDNQLLAVALADGAEIWRITLPSGAAGAPVLTSSGQILAAAGPIIFAFDASTGQEQWRHEMAGALSAPMLVTEAGDLILADAFGYVESLPAGAGPAAGAWPMGWADERRTGRARRP
jgi:outer membrane protein assembly factor BamB